MWQTFNCLRFHVHNGQKCANCKLCASFWQLVVRIWKWSLHLQIRHIRYWVNEKKYQAQIHNLLCGRRLTDWDLTYKGQKCANCKFSTAYFPLPATFKQDLFNIIYSSKSTVQCNTLSNKNFTTEVMAAFQLTEISLTRICKYANCKLCASFWPLVVRIWKWSLHVQIRHVRHRRTENEYQAQVQNLPCGRRVTDLDLTYN